MNEKQSFYDVEVVAKVSGQEGATFNIHLPADDASQAIDFALPMAELEAEKEGIKIASYLCIDATDA